jgi:hypothetical protein
MAPEPQSYAISGQYRLSPYQHPNPSFNPPQHNAPSYHPYPFDPQSYYPSSAVPPQNGFNQPATMILHRNVEHNSAIGRNALQNPLTSYTPPPTLQRDIRVSNFEIVFELTDLANRRSGESGRIEKWISGSTPRSWLSEYY